MFPGKFISKAYLWLRPRRLFLFFAFSMLLIFALISIRGISIKEDIRLLLPSTGSQVQKDFDLLQSLPTSRQILIHLRATQPSTRQHLFEASKDIRRKISSSMQLTVANKLLPDQSRTVLTLLLKHAPRLLDRQDLVRLDKRLQTDALDEVMKKNLQSLVMRPGPHTGELIQADPIHIRDLVLPKLKRLSKLINADIQRGELFSKDGRHLLIIARSKASITDSQAADSIVNELEQIRAQLPPGIKASFISGYHLNRDNSRIIKSDLKLIIIVSFVLLTLVSIFYLRSLKGLFVLAAPLVALLAAVAWAAMLWPSLSGIVIGFGAVLLGIAVDYSLHIYFSIGYSQRPFDETIIPLAQPLSLGFITSFAAFAALLLSSIQGFRQLAEFAMVGLLASFLFSVFVLPQAIGNMAGLNLKRPMKPTSFGRSKRAWLWGGLAIWLITGLATIWSLDLDTDLRHLGYTPNETVKAQKRFVSVWGDVQSRSVALVHAETIQKTLALNQRLFDELQKAEAPKDIISIAPLLPSHVRQEANQKAWLEFFGPQRTEQIKARISAAAVQNGFKPNAFEAFASGLGKPCPPLTVHEFVVSGLEPLTGFFISKQGNMHRISTVLTDGTDLSPGLRKKLGVLQVSQRGFSLGLAEAIRREMGSLILSALLLAGLVMGLFLKSVRLVVFSLLPALCGLIGSAIYINLFSLGVNLFHVAAAPLVIGLGADYGIFMMYPHKPGRRKAIWVSGLTTVSGFGVLALARHPALHSLGITVLIGVSTAVVCALYIVPQLIQHNGASKQGKLE
jgi:predicted exporter